MAVSQPDNWRAGTRIFLLCLGCGGWLGNSAATSADTSADITAGKELAFNRDKGNCLACHAIEDGELPGNVAPPLLAMKQRYPDRADLASQIRDPSGRNPRSTMPPFGRHRILSDEEINLIVSYLYSL